jgi:hypothetical protein
MAWASRRGRPRPTGEWQERWAHASRQTTPLLLRSAPGAGEADSEADELVGSLEPGQERAPQGGESDSATHGCQCEKAVSARTAEAHTS